MEQIVNVAVPQIIEEIVEVPKVVLQERIHYRTVDRIVNVLVSRVVEKIVEVAKIVLQERVS